MRPVWHKATARRLQFESERRTSASAEGDVDVRTGEVHEQYNLVPATVPRSVGGECDLFVLIDRCYLAQGGARRGEVRREGEPGRGDVGRGDAKWGGAGWVREGAARGCGREGAPVRARREGAARGCGVRVRV